MITLRSICVLFCFLTTEIYAQPSTILVADRADDIGADLDRIANDLILEASPQIQPFEALQRNVNQSFFSIPTILQLMAVEESLSSKVDQVAAAGEFQIGMSVDGGNRTSSSASDGRTNTQSVTATKILSDFGSLDDAIQQVEADASATRFDIEVMRSEALLEMVLATLALHTSEQKLVLARSFFDTRLKFQDFIVEKKELGVSSDADVIRAQAKTYEAQAALPAAYQTLQDTKDVFAEIYGFEAPAAVDFAIPGFDPFNAKLSKLVAEHPVVGRAEAQLQVANYQLTSFNAGDNGSFNLQIVGSRGKVPSADTESRLDVKVIYERTLGDGGSRDAQKRLYRASISEYEQSLELTRRDVTRSIQSARNALVAAEAELAAQLETLKSVQKANQATKELFVFNRASLTDVFQIQEEYVSAAQAVVDSKAAVKRRYYELLHESHLLLSRFELGI